jgi:hypothetical protein
MRIAILQCATQRDSGEQLLEGGRLFLRGYKLTNAFRNELIGALACRRGQTIRGWLYPIHTGEAGGVIGRIVSLSVGCWLATMLALGISLWRRTRAPRRVSGGGLTVDTDQRCALNPELARSPSYDSSSPD